MKEDLISIIVPIYNVEKYLERCIESILKQTYKNIEIILVDDGSPDKCSEICDRYSNIDDRIKVIHKQNGGLSSARNAGLDVSKGKYVCFIDSDDWISNEFVEYLYKIAKNNDSDIVVGQTIDVKSEEEVKIIPQNEEVYTYSNSYIIENLYKQDIKFVPSVQNKMYKIDIFKDLRFKEGMINEDEEILIKILLNSKKITISNKILYYYFLSEDSIMRKKFSLKRLDILKALETRMNILKTTRYLDTLKQTEVRYYRELSEIYSRIEESDIEGKKIYQRDIRVKMKKFKIKLKKNKYFTMKVRVKTLLNVYFPTLVYMYRELKKL